jgi:beta-1,2-mannobiose phosphorylase / 1,2-beta-oligomannan phosphorylase
MGAEMRKPSKQKKCSMSRSKDKVKKTITSSTPKTARKITSKSLKHPIGVIAEKGQLALFFKSVALGKVGLYLTKSKTGMRFDASQTKISISSDKGQAEDLTERENISISPCDKGYFMTFIHKSKTSTALMGAVSENLKVFKTIGKISTAKEQGMLAPNYKYRDKYVIYLGNTAIRTAASDDLKKWKISKVSCLSPRKDFFDHSPISVLSVSLTAHGLLVVYDASYKKNNQQALQVGGALFSIYDPDSLIWRSEAPLWQETLPLGSEEVYSIGAAFYKEKIFLYFASKTRKLMAVSLPKPFPGVSEKKAFANLKRFYKNPIIMPRPANEWESDATFNPAALYDDGKVHLLYRAVGKGGFSCLGYASTRDGFTIDEKLSEPAYYPRKAFEGVHTMPRQRTDLYKSGCGWGGCEDPKLTAIEDTIYLTYVAYSGYSHPRIALSSIKRDDFLRKQWRWKEPILISPPGVVDKSGCILPEKIKGKYVIFHRIFPHILIDYRDDLKFEDGKWLESKHAITTRPHMWDSRKLSVGATPIKTEDGWLVIYHAVDDRDDTKYKMGAMILDLEDPSKVLYRTSNPILEPDEHYENDGKPGVVYPCGAVVLEKELFVYYGGGDKFVCCATAQLDKFIENVKKDKISGYQLKEISYK